MVTINAEISNKVYRERFFSGQKFVKFVADLFKAEDFTVRTPLQRVKKIKFGVSDRGDIQIIHNGETRFIVEVKSRKIVFSSLGDYPFREVFIDNVSQYNAKKFQVSAIVIISQITEALFVVTVSTKKYWFTAYVTDEEKQVRVEKYCVEKQFCITWEDMIIKLKNKLES